MKIYFNAIDKELDIDVTHSYEHEDSIEIDFDINNFDERLLSREQFDELTTDIINKLKYGLPDVCNYDI